MALTKLPKNALATGSIDASKIEDGTVAAAEITGTLPADKLASTLNLSSKTVTLPNTSVTNDMLAGSISNAKLANSAITFNSVSKALGTSFDLIADVDWQSVVTGNTTMVAGRGYFVNTTSGAISMTLPSSAVIGDIIKIKDYKGTFGTNNMAILRNGHKIQGASLNSTIATNKASLALVYVDATKGWLYTQEYNVANKSAPSFTTATGGTVTTSGDYKIHTFTGDGNFVVSSAGNQPIFTNPSPQYSASGPGKVDYLVIAGGGAGSSQFNSGGGAGGGGAGGFRESESGSSGSWTQSPLAVTGSCAGVTIDAGTYPIQVGAGAAGGPQSPSQGPSGTPSIFSTITSAGGGGGGGSTTAGANGGSGGGGGGFPSGGQPGGSGNTPPVSPPQGSNGGTGSQPPSFAAGGGGGAGGNGGNASGGTAGTAGAGITTSFNGSPVTRAGGGGSGFYKPQGGTASSGGPGGGGDGSASDTNGQLSAANATANTGSGGGGANRGTGPTPITGGNGGKGVVILRYKFQ